MSKMFAAVILAVLAVTAKAEVDSLFSLDAELPTVTQQRALLATAGAVVYYSPSPVAYSPSPVYSPSPAVYSPKPSPSPSPKASPKPAPKARCYFPRTRNSNVITIVLRSTTNWGAGRDALVKAFNAVLASPKYAKYKLAGKLKIKVIGGGVQKKKKPVQAFKYKVIITLPFCQKYKEGLRASLHTALRTVKYTGLVSRRSFKVVA